MRKWLNLLATVPVVAALMSVGPAKAQTLVYSTQYYSDASHTTMVGFLVWTHCDENDNPAVHLIGRTSPYQVSEPAGYCQNGAMVPL
ncbi:MAG TPA: hypothetical protein VMG08_08675 [Allosphingosinicella sp.]|nr:hypothetical protein [Allosphingosinicella sp.]